MMRNCLVIGSSGGIGRAIVMRQQREHYNVIGVDRHRWTNRGLLKEFISVDLRQRDELAKACETLAARSIRLWSIVYAAGVYPIIPLKDYSLDLWDEVHAVNVTAAFIVAKILSANVIRGCRIVFIGSGASHLGSRDIGYSSSKGALVGLAKSLSGSLAARRILVNVVSPGPIDSPMSRRMPKKRVKEYVNRIMLRRFGRAREVAAAVSFLVSSDNTYMTGATIDVNGGLYCR